MKKYTLFIIVLVLLFLSFASSAPPLLELKVK